MDAKLLEELTAPEAKRSLCNWYTKLPPDVQATLCAVRVKWREAPFCKLRTLLDRLQAKYEGLPGDVKRLSEFLKNDRSAYPDVEVIDGGSEQR